LPHSSGNVVFTAKEHSAVDTILGVFAPDILTGGRVTYELEGADAGYFRVNDKGQFRLRRTLDFATGDRYELAVIATDDRQQSAFLNVIVMDAAKASSDHDAGGKSKWTRRDLPHSSGNVVFTAKEHSAVDTILGVFAPDILTGGRVTYELEGADAGYFRVNDKGQFRLRRTLDFATGDRYYLTVIATDDQQQSAFLNVIVMNAAKAPPPQPKPPVIRYLEESEIGLSWPAQEEQVPVTEVAIQYKRSSDPESSYADVILPPRQPDHLWYYHGYTLRDWTDQRVIPGTSYDVRLRVRNAFGWSPWSRPLTVTPRGTPPGKPGLPRIKNLGATQFRIEWPAPSKGSSSATQVAIQYKRSSAPESAYTDVKPTPGRPSYRNFTRGFNLEERPGQSILPGTSYDVRVRERNGSGWGPWSDAATATTEGSRPQVAPTYAATSIALRVAENAAAGTNLGTAVTATDPHGDTLTYALGATADDNHFAIDE
jgi:hypothetical protein